MDFDSLAKAGSMLGSGGVVVINEDACMVDLAGVSCISMRTNLAAGAFPAAKARHG